MDGEEVGPLILEASQWCLLTLKKLIGSWKRQDEEDDLSTRSGYISEGDCEQIQASGML